jgi:integrase
MKTEVDAMAVKSSRSPRKRKPPNGKPEKPYDEFPLFPHANGRWAKKIRGRLCYFGRWATRKNGELQRVQEDGWKQALDDYKRQADDLHAGRTPRLIDGDGCALRQLCNTFLTSKKNKLENGELSPQTFADYYTTSERLLRHFGKSCQVLGLRPDDFERFRKQLAKEFSIVTLKNEINRCRIIFKYAFDQRLISEPVTYGQSFEKPSARLLRKARNDAGPRLFESEELRRIIDVADPWLRAMVLLGINGGLGNTDVANLPQSAIDFDSGWLTYPRPKTEVQRRIPLWPKTLEALRAAIASRPRPKDSTDAGLCFLTVQGNRWVRTTPSASAPERFVTRNTVAGRFGPLLRRLGINGRKGLGFYTLRHCFETVAGGSKDQVAVNAIMGHADQSMAAVYREGISDERLLAVTDFVRHWLFGADGKE